MRSLVYPLVAGTITLCLLSVAPVAKAQVVSLQNATATFSQTFSQTFSGQFSVAQAISGTAANDRGWAIFDPNAAGDNTSPQTAAFQTVSNAGLAGGTQFTFNLNQNYNFTSGALDHLVGRFRLSYTTANRSTFADGLPTGGNIGTNWTVLTPLWSPLRTVLH